VLKSQKYPKIPKIRRKKKGRRKKTAQNTQIIIAKKRKTCEKLEKYKTKKK